MTWSSTHRDRACANASKVRWPIFRLGKLTGHHRRVHSHRQASMNCGLIRDQLCTALSCRNSSNSISYEINSPSLQHILHQSLNFLENSCIILTSFDPA